MKLIERIKKIERKTLIQLLIVIPIIIFLIVGESYVWYTREYLPSNYGKKTVGVVYKRVSGRKSAMDIYVHYKVNDSIYSLSAQINPFEITINRPVEVGEKFFVLYYPPHPEYAKIDLNTGLIKDSAKINF